MRQPPARVWEDPVAHPNLSDAQTPELAARSASRLDAGLGSLLPQPQVVAQPGAILPCSTKFHIRDGVAANSF